MEWLRPSRPMKYPYTLSAKIAQFPFKHYWKYCTMFKLWIIGSLLTVPVFYKIHKLANHPENVAKWKEIHRKQFSGEQHH